MSKRLIPLAILLVFLLSTPATAARQLKASHPPRTAGPLEDAGRSCNPQTVRAEGRVIARVEACVFIFTFDRLAETDLLRHYGVAWVQFTFDAGKGVCAERLQLILEFEDDATIHAMAPHEPIRGARGETKTVTLEVTAGGTALEDGSVSQDLVMLPRSLSAGAGARRGTIDWSGRSGQKIALAGGVEISWDELDPPERFRVDVGAARLDRC